MITDLRLCQATSCPPAMRSWPCAQGCCLVTSAGMQLLSSAVVAADSRWISSTHSATAALTAGVQGSWSRSSRCRTLSILAAGTWLHSCFTCMPLAAGSASAHNSTACTLDRCLLQCLALIPVLQVSAVHEHFVGIPTDMAYTRRTPYEATVDAETSISQVHNEKRFQQGGLNLMLYPRQLKGNRHTACETGTPGMQDA